MDGTKFVTYVHGSQIMNPTDFGVNLTEKEDQTQVKLKTTCVFVGTKQTKHHIMSNVLSNTRKLTLQELSEPLPHFSY